MANLEEVGIVSLTDKWQNEDNNSSVENRRNFKFLGSLSNLPTAIRAKQFSGTKSVYKTFKTKVQTVAIQLIDVA